MDQHRLSTLLNKYHEGILSEQEKIELDDWFHSLNPGGREFEEWVNEMGGEERYTESRFEDFQARVRKTKRLTKIRYIQRIAAAASVLVVLSVGYYVFWHKQHKVQVEVASDIPPAGNQAILTLSNGKKIVLSGKQGQIATQAGKAVVIGASGDIAYTGTGNSSEVIYNTLTVPIGNRRDLTLPDGSQISLDAGSSVTYPVVFTKDRKIAITGQVYVKVKHDAEHPFYTTVRGITIKDIGTEFNVDAYEDEPDIKTTLIKGSVQVNGTYLRPGEQAQINDKHLVVKKADLDVVTAWKNNDFYFSDESLRISMRQIARWYNVSVVYKDVNEKLKIFVDVSRTRNLSVVLKALENTGKVKCRLEGRTITVSEPN